jgi:hypothetical protein
MKSFAGSEETTTVVTLKGVFAESRNSRLTKEEYAASARPKKTTNS